MFREGLNRLLDTEPDFQVVANCSSAREGLATLSRQSIDLVLLDFDLGEERASEFLIRARELGYAGRVLMVTAGMDDRDSAQFISEGVAGIFPKNSAPSLLMDAIRKVMIGETWLDSRSVQALAAAAQRSEAPESRSALTDRERSVLRGVFEGLGNKGIAAQLGISESSVKAALQQLFQKTGVRTRSQLVRIALERYAHEWQPEAFGVSKS